MADLTLETLRAELASILRVELTSIRGDLAIVKDSLPLASRALTTLR
jgi:hypothetical protein